MTDGDLEQQVSQLVAQPVEIAGVERFERLIRLLEQVRPQAEPAKTLQPKRAGGAQSARPVQMKLHPTPPPVYRPQPMPKYRLVVVLSNTNTKGDKERFEKTRTARPLIAESMS